MPRILSKKSPTVVTRPRLGGRVRVGSGGANLQPLDGAPPAVAAAANGSFDGKAFAIKAGLATLDKVADLGRQVTGDALADWRRSRAAVGE